MEENKLINMVVEGKLFSSGLNRSEKIARLYIQLK